MRRLSLATNKILSLYNNNNNAATKIQRRKSTAFDVFISHRRVDTRQNVAGVLYEQLAGVGRRPFLDSRSMSPGDNLMKKIEGAIKSCRVGIPVLSPRYCESYYCLYELALMLRCNKNIIPIFCDVKPSQLRVPHGIQRLQRFSWAIDEAKCTVGISFDSSNGDWPQLLSNVSDAVMKRLVLKESFLDHKKP